MLQRGHRRETSYRFTGSGVFPHFRSGKSQSGKCGVLLSRLMNNKHLRKSKGRAVKCCKGVAGEEHSTCSPDPPLRQFHASKFQNRKCGILLFQLTNEKHLRKSKRRGVKCCEKLTGAKYPTCSVSAIVDNGAAFSFFVRKS